MAAILSRHQRSMCMGTNNGSTNNIQYECLQLCYIINVALSIYHCEMEYSFLANAVGRGHRNDVLCLFICLDVCSSIRSTVHMWIRHTFFTYFRPWWRHQMETFSVLLALCAGNSPVTGEFPAQRPVRQSFAVFFYLRLNRPLSK